MSKNSPAFQFYPQDFLVGTAEMTAEEVGGYIRLLCYQWTKGELPNNDKKLMQLSLVFDLEALKAIKSKFEVRKDGTIVNLKMEKVQIEQVEYREKQRVKANKMWESKRDATALQQDKDGICQNDALQPLTFNLQSSSLNLNLEPLEIKAEKSKRFIPPTYKQVQEYCLERKNKVDPQKFVDFYTSKDWKVGKNKMKDWKASVRTWEGNQQQNNNNNGTINNETGRTRTLEDQADDMVRRVNALYSGSNEQHPDNESNTEDSNCEIVE